MKMRMAVLALALPLGFGACAEYSVAPESETAEEIALQQQGRRPGTGLVLESLTGLALPLVPIELGEVIIEQVVITDLRLVEDVVGGIIGVEAEGVLQLTGGVLGTDVVTEDFRAAVGITSTGPGQCELVSIDLAPIEVNILGELATVDVPAAEVTGRGSGAVGSLLCTLGALLGGLGSGVDGVVNGINNLI